MQFRPITIHAIRIFLYLTSQEGLSASEEIAEQMNVPQKNYKALAAS